MKNVYSVSIGKDELSEFKDIDEIAKKCSCLKAETKFDSNNSVYYTEYYSDTLSSIVKFQNKLPVGTIMIF